ncbi:NlpC/P60 family protein [Lachnospira multipara]|uniref:NlpC/P60 family protein n=1 Tax=Lachnospira multipara TaxID=28051 RepID=A0A1H5WVN0_9FIRM|nr:NlpC/P60 family protein [Lachnospira multipara]SEG03649.1 NlpC/P60 family protein [Lachnospira multipara]
MKDTKPHGKIEDAESLYYKAKEERASGKTIKTVKQASYNTVKDSEAAQEKEEIESKLRKIGIDIHDIGSASGSKLFLQNEDNVSSIKEITGDSDYRHANSQGMFSTNIVDDYKHNSTTINTALEKRGIVNAKDLRDKDIRKLRAANPDNKELKILLNEKQKLNASKRGISTIKQKKNIAQKAGMATAENNQDALAMQQINSTKKQIKTVKTGLRSVEIGVNTIGSVAINAKSLETRIKNGKVAAKEYKAAKKDALNQSTNKFFHPIENSSEKFKRKADTLRQKHLSRQGRLNKVESKLQKAKPDSFNAKRLIKKKNKLEKRINRKTPLINRMLFSANEKRIKILKKFDLTERIIKRVITVTIIAAISLSFLANAFDGFNKVAAQNLSNIEIPEDVSNISDEYLEIDEFAMPSSKDSAVSKSYYIYNELKKTQTAYIENLYNAGANSEYNSYSIPSEWKSTIENNLENYSDYSSKISVSSNGSFVGFNLSKYFGGKVNYDSVYASDGNNIVLRAEPGINSIDAEHDLNSESSDNIQTNGNTKTITTSYTNDNTNTADNIVISTHFPEESSMMEMAASIMTASILVNGADADEDTHISWCQDILAKMLNNSSINISTSIENDNNSSVNFYYQNAQYSTTAKKIIITIDISFNEDTSLSHIIETAGITLEGDSKSAYDYVFSDFDTSDFVDLVGLDSGNNPDSISNGGYSHSYTSEEIAAIIGNTTLSDRQKKIIDTATSMQGQITYYYGGKPTNKGTPVQTNVGTNGSPTSANSYGENIAGLDCFGFCDWVYWTAFGERVLAIGSTMSTTSVHNNGADGLTLVSSSELQPGDLGFQQGHVGIYVGQDSEGHYVFCHCVGTPSSTVVVNTYAEFDVFYRVNVMY